MNYSFKQYLMEAAVGPDLNLVSHGNDIATLVHLFNTHCSDARWMIKQDTPLYRGVRGDIHDDILAVDPTKTQRKSQNTLNYYTLIFDHLPERVTWPKRSRSLIATTLIRTAEDYGAVRVVIPFNRVKIGCINSEDMFDTQLDMAMGAHIADVNYVWKELGLSPFDWNDWIEFDQLPAEELEARYDTVLVAKANDAVPMGRNQIVALLAVLRRNGFLRGVQQLYSNAHLSPSHSVATTKSGLAQAEAGEVWVGGPCLITTHGLWQQLRSSQM